MLKALLQRGLITLLNQSRLLEHINTLIEQAVLFAKNVPYFMNIHESDRISLLKSCVFDVICVRHSIFYRANKPETDTVDLATLAACAVAASNSNGVSSGGGSGDGVSGVSYSISNSSNNTNTTNHSQGRFFIPYWDVWLTQESINELLPELGQFVNMLFDFYFYFNSMVLNEFEIAIFSSFLLFNFGNFW